MKLPAHTRERAAVLHSQAARFRARLRRPDPQEPEVIAELIAAAVRAVRLFSGDELRANRRESYERRTP